MKQIQRLYTAEMIALLTVLCAIVAGPSSARATTTLRLSHTFIDANCDRVTFDATLLVAC